MTQLTEREYRALPLESYSSLKTLLISPKEYHYYKNNPFKGNDRTLLGTAVHHFLQGNKHLVLFHNKSKTKKLQAPEQKLLVGNVEDGLTQTSEPQIQQLKTIEEIFLEANEEGIIVPERFEEQIQKIMENVNQNEQILKIMRECVPEVPYLFEVEGLNLKARLDFECNSYIADIKTTSMGISHREFAETVDLAHYDLQAALYQKAVYLKTGILKPYYFIAVSTKAPYMSAVFKMSKRSLNRGLEKLDIVLERYKRFIINKEVWEDGVEEV